jgi:hypothetical protein
MTAAHPSPRPWEVRVIALRERCDAPTLASVRRHAARAHEARPRLAPWSGGVKVVVFPGSAVDSADVDPLVSIGDQSVAVALVRRDARVALLWR